MAMSKREGEIPAAADADGEYLKLPILFRVIQVTATYKR